MHCGRVDLIGTSEGIIGQNFGAVEVSRTRRDFDNEITDEEEEQERARMARRACPNAIFVRIEKTPRRVESSLEKKFKGEPRISRGR